MEDSLEPRQEPAPPACQTGAFVVRSPAEGWIELTAPSRDEYLDRISEFVERLAGARLDQGTLEDVKLAVCEVAQNAMEWGNRNDERRKVRVSYGLFDDEIVLKVEDEGPGFDSTEVPDAGADPLEVVRASRKRSGKRFGGLGLFVARKLMDSVIFNEPGNVALLTKRLRPAPDGGRGGVNGGGRRGCV